MFLVVIGIDIGTFESKGVLVDGEGAVLAEARVRHGVSTPQPGWVEHDPNMVWWGDFCEISRQLTARADEIGATIAAVGCSAVGPCVAALDLQGEPLRPAILYGIDTRAGRQIDVIRHRLGDDEIRRRCGNTLSSQSAGPKIAWVVENEPEVHARTRWYATSQSFLVHRLTGRMVIDHATAGYFHPVYEQQTGAWNASGLEDLIDPSRLPEVAWSSEIAGTVTAQASVETGIPEGVSVIVGTTDAPAEAVAAGVLAPGDMMLMYGSSTFMIDVLDEPLSDDVLWSAPFVFPATFVLAGGTSTAGTATRWICDVLGLDDSRGDAAMFGDLMGLARSADPGSRGVMMLPHLAGERTPIHDPETRGVLLGLGLDTGRAEIARAVVEGIGHSVAHALERYDAIGRRPETILAIGGGTRNEILLQTVSDISGHPQRLIDTVGAAFGDALLAALAVGLLPDRSGIRDWVAGGARVQPRPENDSVRLTLIRDHEDYRDAYEVLALLQRRRSG